MKKIFDEGIGIGCLTLMIILPLALIIIAVLNLPIALFAMWLWNLIAVDLFAAPVITFWQMYGLIFLINALIPHTSNIATSLKD